MHLHANITNTPISTVLGQGYFSTLNKRSEALMSGRDISNLSS